MLILPIYAMLYQYMLFEPGACERRRHEGAEGSGGDFPPDPSANGILPVKIERNNLNLARPGSNTTGHLKGVLFKRP